MVERVQMGLSTPIAECTGKKTTRETDDRREKKAREVSTDINIELENVTSHNSYYITRLKGLNKPCLKSKQKNLRIMSMV